MTDLTIIIPTKNRLWSLPKAVESCRSTSLDVQIIVVDDESTDGTSEWLKQQPDVTEVSGGGWGKPFAVNKALPLIKGEFFRFLDSDDWFPEGTLAQQVSVARLENADLVVSGYNIYDTEERFVEEKPWIKCDDFISQQLGECDSSHYSAYTFRTASFHDIPHRSNFPSADFASRDDRCFMLEVALRNPKIVSTNNPGLCHRHHVKERLQRVEGFSADAANLNLLLIYKTILERLDDKGQLTERRRKAAATALGNIAEWLSDRELPTALALLDVVNDLRDNTKNQNRSTGSFLRNLLGLRNYFRLRNLRRSVKDIFSIRNTLSYREYKDWIR